MRLSKRLKEALRFCDEPLWKLAASVNLHPSALSRYLHDRHEIRRKDKRLLKLARRLGVPKDEAFEP